RPSASADWCLRRVILGSLDSDRLFHSAGHRPDDLDPNARGDCVSSGDRSLLSRLETPGGILQRAARDCVMKTIFTALKLVSVMGGFGFLWGWGALGLEPYDRRLGIRLPGAIPLGIAFMLAGGLLALSCVGLFVVRGEGTPAPFDAPRQFVAAEPY